MAADRAALRSAALGSAALRSAALAWSSAAMLFAAPALLPAHASAWCQMTTSDLAPTASEPCILAANHPGEHPLAWRRRCTEIALSTNDASDSLSDADVRAVLGRSIASWEAVTCGGTPTALDIEVLAETTAVDRARHFASGRNVNALIFVHSGWSSDRDHHPLALAVTYVWHDPSTGEIFDGDIELNEDTNTFVICPAGGCTSVPTDTADLENTLTHELGHYFGIAHTPDDRDATMWSMASAGEVLKRDLAADDRAALCGIYPPGALPETCDYTPRGGLGLDGAPPSGCSVAAPGARGRGTGTPLFLSAMLALALAPSIRRRRL